MRDKPFKAQVPGYLAWQIDVIWPALWGSREEYISHALRNDLVNLWGSRGFGPLLRLARQYE